MHKKYLAVLEYLKNIQVPTEFRAKNAAFIAKTDKISLFHQHFCC